LVRSGPCGCAPGRLVVGVDNLPEDLGDGVVVVDVQVPDVVVPRMYTR
jgi:hypothetical protein